MKTLKDRLFELQDLEYKKFQKRLIPNIENDDIIGVRIPILRKLAKKVSNDEASEFLKNLPHKYYDENNLHAFLIENIKNCDECIKEIEKFLPYIDNWATCDLLSPKILKKHPDELYEKIKIWIKSEHTYTVRFAIVMLISNYLDENFKQEMLHLVKDIKTQQYYINMAIAWYFSFALIKQYDFAISIIKEKSLDKFVHNKSIQKAVESYRIDDETKQYLKTLKLK